MRQTPYYADATLLTDYKESVNAIEKDIKFMNSTLKYVDYSDLSYDDKLSVEEGLDSGELAVKYIKEFNKLTSNYISSFAFVKMDFGGLTEQNRHKLMKQAGDLYDKIYDAYKWLIATYNALAKFRYVSKIKLQKHVA